MNNLDEELCNMANAEPNARKLVTEYEDIKCSLKNKFQDKNTETKTDHRENCAMVVWRAGYTQEENYCSQMTVPKNETGRIT